MPMGGSEAAERSTSPPCAGEHAAVPRGRRISEPVFSAMHGQVVLDGVVPRPAAHRLPHLPSHQLGERLGDDPHGLRAQLGDQPRGVRKQEVAREDGDDVRPPRVRPLCAPRRMVRLVHDVVVIQRREVDELHDGRAMTTSAPSGRGPISAPRG